MRLFAACVGAVLGILVPGSVFLVLFGLVIVVVCAELVGVIKRRPNRVFVFQTGALFVVSWTAAVICPLSSFGSTVAAIALFVGVGFLDITHSGYLLTARSVYIKEPMPEKEAVMSPVSPSESEEVPELVSPSSEDVSLDSLM